MECPPAAEIIAELVFKAFGYISGASGRAVVQHLEANGCAALGSIKRKVDRLVGAPVLRGGKQSLHTAPASVNDAKVHFHSIRTLVSRRDRAGCNPRITGTEDAPVLEAAGLKIIQREWNRGEGRRRLGSGGNQTRCRCHRNGRRARAN